MADVYMYAGRLSSCKAVTAVKGNSVTCIALLLWRCSYYKCGLYDHNLSTVCKQQQ